MGGSRIEKGLKKGASIPKKKEIFFRQNDIEAITVCVISPSCWLGDGTVFAGGSFNVNQSNSISWIFGR